MLDLFDGLKNRSFHFQVSSPIVCKLLRLAMIHPETIATCERSFSLMRVIKSCIRSTMTYDEENMVEKLSSRMHYSESHFTKYMQERSLETADVDEKIEKWIDVD